MSNKERQKELLKAWKAAEKSKARSLFPLPDVLLVQFFEMLEDRVEAFGCRHDTRLAQAVIDDLKLADDQANALLAWCSENGGFCDCEVAGNAHQHWLENRLPT